MMVKKIPLPNGEFAMVDDEDYERVNRHFWYVMNGDSGASVLTSIDGKERTLGQYILEDIPQGKVVIRLNTKRFDFTKRNLRVIKPREINHYRKGVRNSTSKYKGVSFEKFTGKWKAQLVVNGVKVISKRFNSEEEAALAYNEAVKKHLPKGAYLNDIGSNNNNDFEPITSTTSQHRSVNKDSKYRGVYKKYNRFQARLNFNNRQLYLGTFDSEEEAAIAFDVKSKELYGDKALLNFPEKRF